MACRSRRLILLLLGLFVLSAGAASANIQYDSTSVGRCFSCSSRTISHTVTGTDRLLTIQVATLANTGGSSSCTYDGVPATFIDAETNTGCQSGFRCRVELLRLIAPNTGTHDLACTFSVAAVEMVVGGISQTGVHQTIPTGTPIKTIGTGTAPSITLSSASDEVLVGIMAKTLGFNQTPSPSNGATSNFIDNGSGGFLTAGGSYQTGSLSPLYGWIYATSSPFAILAVPVKPATGGGGPTVLSETLLWNDNSTNETTFRLQWKHALQLAYADLAVLGPNIQTYSVNYTTETQRCYRIRTENTGGNSSFSNELCASITAPGPILTPLTPPQLGGGLADE